jgi:hypothetical protein
MSGKKKRPPQQRRPAKKLYCIDCGVQLDPELTLETEMMKQELKMPNMLIFCDKCRSKPKNVIRRIWNGFKYLFE